MWGDAGRVGGTGLTFATHNSRFKTIVNRFADDLPFGNDWNTWFRDILNDYWGDDAIDIVAIDHYPGTWCCGSNYRDWGALDSLANLAQEFGKEIGVMETGLSTEDPLDIFGGHTYWDQEVFVNEALNEVLIKRNAYNAQRPLNVLILVSWYELIDRCSTCLLSGEDNWGILFGDQFALGP